MDARMVEAEARHLAFQLSKIIALEANKKAPVEVGVFAGVAASIVLQTVIVSMLVKRFEPGSAAGEAELALFYDNAKKDALKRWHKSDLKERRAGGFI